MSLFYVVLVCVYQIISCSMYCFTFFNMMIHLTIRLCQKNDELMMNQMSEACSSGNEFVTEVGHGWGGRSYHLPRATQPGCEIAILQPLGSH